MNSLERLKAKQHHRHNGCGGSKVGDRWSRLVFLSMTLCQFGASLSVLIAALLMAPASSIAKEPTLKDVLKDSTAQEKVEKAGPTSKPAATPVPDDKYGRGVPRTMALGFVEATNKGDYEHAAEYLDLRNLPRGMSAEQGPELARQLRVVLDRKLWVDINALSGEPRGQSDDGLPGHGNRAGHHHSVPWAHHSVH